MCCDGQRGAEPPAHLDCRPSTVRGRCPQPSGFYSRTAEYLMPGAAPRRGCPLFYFFNQKIGRIKEEQGAAVFLLCGWGSMWHSGRGSHPGSFSLFQWQGSCTPSPVLQGHQDGLAQPEGWVEGQSCAGLQEQLVLVSLAGMFSLPCRAGYSPCLPSQPGISNGGRVVWSGKLCPTLPAAHSALFQPNVLYEIVILLEINYGGGPLPRRAWGHASWQCLPPWECIYYGDFLRL